MYSTKDINVSVDSEGHPVYSLPNGDSVTSVGRLPYGQIDKNFNRSYENVAGSQLAYLVDNRDSYINAVNQQALWNREDLLRKDAEKREDYQLDRWVEAARRNGINPIFLLDSAGAAAGSAASYSTSAAKTSNYEASARTSQANSASIIGAIIAAVAALGAAFASSNRTTTLKKG